MFGWVNGRAKVIHAHGMLVGGESNWTACGRVKLWGEGDSGIREGYKFASGATETDLRRCSHCVNAVKSRAEWLMEWLGA